MEFNNIKVGALFKSPTSQKVSNIKIVFLNGEFHTD